MENEILVKQDEHGHQTYERSRFWQERLFSLPWKPWRKIETGAIGIPGPIIEIGGELYCRHDQVDQIRKRMTEMEIVLREIKGEPECETS